MLMAYSQGTGRFIPASARVTCAQRPTFVSRQDQHKEVVRAPELPVGLGEERGGGGASSAETSPPSPASLPPFSPARTAPVNHVQRLPITTGSASGEPHVR